MLIFLQTMSGCPVQRGWLKIIPAFFWMQEFRYLNLPCTRQCHQYPTQFSPANTMFSRIFSVTYRDQYLQKLFWPNFDLNNIRIVLSQIFKSLEKKLRPINDGDKRPQCLGPFKTFEKSSRLHPSGKTFYAAAKAVLPATLRRLPFRHIAPLSSLQ